MTDTNKVIADNGVSFIHARNDEDEDFYFVVLGVLTAEDVEDALVERVGEDGISHITHVHVETVAFREQDDD